MSILGKYKRWNDCLEIINDEYFDLVLTQDNSPSVGNGTTERCLISFIDCENEKCIVDKGLKSTDEYKWSGAICNDVSLRDIGFTGIDNGMITYDRHSMTKEKFIKILANSNISFNDDDFSLHLNKVAGNIGTYDYSMEKHDGYYALKGGFFQGFYKIFGYDYQVLPQFIENSWQLEFVLRPQDYVIKENTLNNTHKSADGIFFFMGTRSENKFSLFYNGKKEMPEELKEITTSADELLWKKNGQKICTDNKYLFFNRTDTGFTADEWSQCDEVEFETENKTVKKAVPVNDCENKVIVTDNKYLFMNRTKTGYTVGDIERETSTLSSSEYDMLSDILGNAFALKINDKGELGYSYLVKDCDNELGYALLEEFGVDNPETGFSSFKLKKGEWYTISVRFQILSGELNSCGKPKGQRHMRIYMYVNGYLKFISKILPEFNFRELNDSSEKQEGVPFSISLGGGTQGLGESVWLDYHEVFAPGLLIEKSFAGTFIGDIKSFKFYDCGLQYMEVKNNNDAN